MDWVKTEDYSYIIDCKLIKSVFVSTLPKHIIDPIEARKYNDHEHCEFCFDKISEYDGDIHEAYCTIDKNHWICPECFEDFKNMFHWTL